MRKKIIASLVLAVSLLAGVFIGNDAYASEEGKKVDVMFMHDMHSHLNPFATVEEGKSQVLGGFARI